MVLYTMDAKNFYIYGGDERQLSSNVVAAFGSTNLAMVRSEIELEINLIYVARVSAGVWEARPCGTWWLSLCGTEAMCRCLVAFVLVVGVDGSSCAKIAETYAHVHRLK